MALESWSVVLHHWIADTDGVPEEDQDSTDQLILGTTCVATCRLVLHSPFLFFHLPMLVLNHNCPIHQCLEVGIHNGH